MSFRPGALVNTRGRDWVVQPGSDSEFLLLKPLGGRDEEVTGVLRELEEVREATFSLPSADSIGDARSAGLLRDAAMLSFRSSAGPFRSFGRIAVEPRPYQLVPLLMALRQEIVRLLIADDVGIGKTVEALLIARELLDRGEIKSFSILCPPHLAEQWEAELRDKFHIDAVKVLASTAARLERGLAGNESIFEHYPVTIISTDFIKSERRRDEFLRTAPELIIVDEAHTAADSGDGRGGRHQRHELLKGLAKATDRHLILVTATPHSGNETAFRSLLSLLKAEFANLPDDLSGPKNEPVRRELAQYFVQRKRGDIRHYLDAETDFPERDEEDVAFTIGDRAKALSDKVLAFAREELQQDDGTHRQRIRWWAILGLLRALASSPAAAAATLRNRAAPADTTSVAEANIVGRRTVLDQMEDDAPEGIDVTPGSLVDGEQALGTSQRRLQALAKEAEALKGEGDQKLDKLVDILKKLLKDGRSPIVFCRFIDTADYVGEQLRERLGKNVEVASVTGTLPPEEREVRVNHLAAFDKRILVVTDCLSEGINLQNHFDSVVHYDLSWNPTRHEQREGRVDRYGQHRDTVVVKTMYGMDNQIDGVVLNVLLRKHNAIRSSLGISVPVPADNDQMLEAIFEGLLLRDSTRTVQQDTLFDDYNEYVKPKTEDFTRRWDAMAERERRSRTMFAQETIKVDDISRELQEVQAAIGGRETVERFIRTAVQAHDGTIVEKRNGISEIDLANAPAELRDSISQLKLLGRFTPQIESGVENLTRTHPFTESLASFVLDAALDGLASGAAKRAGVMRTDAVSTRTTMLLVRYRYHITTTKNGRTWQTLAEETIPIAFAGAADDNNWLDKEQTLVLLDVEPTGNVLPPQAKTFIAMALRDAQTLEPYLEATAAKQATQLLDAHRRVRDAAVARGFRYGVEPLLPADVLGVYVYIPGGMA